MQAIRKHATSNTSTVICEKLPMESVVSASCNLASDRVYIVPTAFNVGISSRFLATSRAKASAAMEEARVNVTAEAMLPHTPATQPVIRGLGF